MPSLPEKRRFSLCSSHLHLTRNARKCTDITKNYDEEQDMLETIGDKSLARDAPKTNDLKLAYKFLGNKYSYVLSTNKYRTSQRCPQKEETIKAFLLLSMFFCRRWFLCRDFLIVMPAEIPRATTAGALDAFIEGDAIDLSIVIKRLRMFRYEGWYP